eukprot:jgi/Psemu1/49689/gm1.49689_g
MGDNLGYPDNHVMHPGAMLHQGLIIAGFSLTQMERSQPSANDSRFNSAYDDLGADHLWIMTVDGTCCWIAEPGHPNFSQDWEYYSHKFNKAGINYELGIALASNKLIWMNGPFKAGQNDVTIFVKNGLEQCLRYLCKKLIGDGGYRGHNDTASTPNAHDGYGVINYLVKEPEVEMYA